MTIILIPVLYSVTALDRHERLPVIPAIAFMHIIVTSSLGNRHIEDSFVAVAMDRSFKGHSALDQYLKLSN